MRGSKGRGRRRRAGEDPDPHERLALGDGEDAPHETAEEDQDDKQHADGDDGEMLAVRGALEAEGGVDDAQEADEEASAADDEALGSLCGCHVGPVTCGQERERSRLDARFFAGIYV